MPKTVQVKRKTGIKEPDPRYQTGDQAQELDGLSNLDELDAPDDDSVTAQPPDEPDRPEQADTKEDKVEDEKDVEGRKIKTPPVEHIPKPPQYVFSKEKGGTLEGFMTYWRDLPPRFKSRLIAYVYRNWPILDPYYCPACAVQKKLRLPVVEVKPEGKQRKQQRYQCPACGWAGEILKFLEKLVEPLNDADDVLHRWGTGDYHIKLNDTMLKKTIAMCFHQTARDFEHYPPYVVNKMDLDMADPQNQTYVNWLRAKGEIPGIGEQRGGDDVGSEALAEALRAMTDKVVSQNERPAVITPEAQGTAKAMEILAAASEKGMNIVSKAAERSANAPAPINTSNPMEVGKAFIDQVVTLTKALQPPPPPPPVDNSATTNLLISTMEKGFNAISALQSDRIKSLEQSVTESKKEMATAQKPRDILDDIERVAKLKDTFGDLFGLKSKRHRNNDDDDDDDDTSLGKGKKSEDSIGFIARSLPVVVQGLAIIGAIGANIWFNIVAAKTGGMAQKPPSPEEIAKAVGVDPALVPGGDPNASTAGIEGEGDDMFGKFLKQIHKPMLHFLHQEAEEGESNGADFADWLIAAIDMEKSAGEGRKTYNKILAAGRTNLEELLSSYPPLWTELQQVPQLAGEFIDDFLNRDQIRKDQAAREEADEVDEADVNGEDDEDDDDDESDGEGLPIGADERNGTGDASLPRGSGLKPTPAATSGGSATATRTSQGKHHRERDRATEAIPTVVKE